MKFPCVISQGIFHIKQKWNFHLYYNSLKTNLLQNSLLNKNAFQDTYSPLITVRGLCPGDVSVQGGSLSRGVSVQGGSLLGRLLCEQNNWQAGRCKNIPATSFAGDKNTFKDQKKLISITSQLLICPKNIILLICWQIVLLSFRCTCHTWCHSH